MKEDTFETLDEIMDALRVILEDPHFKASSDRPLPPYRRAWQFLSNGLTFHGESLIRENLEEIRKHSPSKLDVLEQALSKGSGSLDTRGARERSLLYQLATAPIFFPRVLGILAFLKFSSRDAQILVHYGTWLVQTVALSAFAAWLSPQLVPGVLVWSIVTEIVDRDLEFEEAWSLGYLFSLLTFVGNTELVLELCQNKGIEFGKLLHVSERYVLFEMGMQEDDSSNLSELAEGSSMDDALSGVDPGHEGLDQVSPSVFGHSEHPAEVQTDSKTKDSSNAQAPSGPVGHLGVNLLKQRRKRRRYWS